MSDIAEKVIPIPLSKDVSLIQGMFWTGDFCYVVSSRDIWQYTTSGDFVRAIHCEGAVCAITGDLVKKELYAVVNIGREERSELWCFDFSGKLRRRIVLRNYCIVSCAFYDNLVWLLSETFADKKVCSHYSYVDVLTNKEIFLQHKLDKPFIKLSSGEFIGAGSTGTLSISNNNLFCNWGDNIIWHIQKGKVKPVMKFEVIQKYRKKLICLKGVVGNYVFFNYYLDDNISNLYLRNLRTGKTYHVNYHGAFGNYTKGAVDDIYNSGYFDVVTAPLNQEGYFWFVKDMRGKLLGNVPVKGNQVVFIVKMKQ